MRKSEILNLKWDNVDLKHGFILLDMTKNGKRREIPINDTLRDVFRPQTYLFASHLVMAGVDITTVKELLGHKTITMTLRYSHLAPSHKVKAVDNWILP